MWAQDQGKMELWHVCVRVWSGAGRSEDPPALLLTALGDLRGIRMEMGKGHFRGQTWSLCTLSPALDGLSPRKVPDTALAGSDILLRMVLLPFLPQSGKEKGREKYRKKIMQISLACMTLFPA